MSIRLLPVLLLACLGLPVQAALPPAWTAPLEQLAEQAAQAALPPDASVDIEIGDADPRLRLAPCAQVQPFLPTGTRLWGRSRIGLRCVSGAVKWSISLPLQVRVSAPAWVAVQALQPGQALQAAQLERRVVEISDQHSPAFTQAEAPLGRELARPLLPGEVLRHAHLKPRQWFAAGDQVSLLLQGDGFAVRASAQALAPGFEGQASRVRLEGGRILQVWPVAERRAELAL